MEWKCNCSSRCRGQRKIKIDIVVHSIYSRVAIYGSCIPVRIKVILTNVYLLYILKWPKYASLILAAMWCIFREVEWYDPSYIWLKLSWGCPNVYHFRPKINPQKSTMDRLKPPEMSKVHEPCSRRDKKWPATKAFRTVEMSKTSDDPLPCVWDSGKVTQVKRYQISHIKKVVFNASCHLHNCHPKKCLFPRNQR